MSRGGSHGGGQSSLGYLFGSEELPSAPPPPRPIEPPYGIDTSSSEKPPVNRKSRVTVDPSEKQKNPNNYHRSEGQNLGNFVTVRSDLVYHVHLFLI